jgi:hypothetical protein
VVDVLTGAFSLPSAVSYGGVGMSSFSSFNWQGAGRLSFQVWYLLDPAVGTANIVATSPPPNAYCWCGASTIDGVDTSSFANAFGTPASASGNNANPTVNVASGANKLVWGLISSLVNVVTISSPSVELASVADGNDPSNGKTLSNNAGNSSETIAGTVTSCEWGVWGVALNPANGASPVVAWLKA